LPFVGAALGLSTLGLGAALGGARPLFLVAAAVLLGYGAYGLLVAPRDDACCEERPARWPRVALVIGAAAVVTALAFFPEDLVGALR